MPDQNSAVRIGDTITADQIITLPVGAIVSDRDGDLYRQNEDGTWSRSFDTPDEYVVKSDSHTAGIRGYFDDLFTPYRLARIPHGPVADGAPDLYQQSAEPDRVFRCDDCGDEFDDDHYGDAQVHADQHGHNVPSWTTPSWDTPAAPPRIEDMAPGTTFTASYGKDLSGTTRWMRCTGPSRCVNVGGVRFDAYAIDPSTIRDVTPPPEDS